MKRARLGRIVRPQREDTRMYDKMTIGSIVQLTETGVEQRIDFKGEDFQ